MSGRPWRFPWDIPVEDFLYGYALLTWVLLRWKADDGEDEPSDTGTRARGAVRAGGGGRADERR